MPIKTSTKILLFFLVAQIGNFLGDGGSALKYAYTVDTTYKTHGYKFNRL